MKRERALRTILAATLAVSLAAPPRVARALDTPAAGEGTPERARAGEAKRRGDEAMDSLRYADALAAYSEAYALSRDPALLYNTGRAYQALGDFPAALAQLERFGTEAPPDLRARVPKLNELLAELRARVSTLTLRSNVAGARVLVRDRVVGTTPLEAPLKLSAGRASLEVSADGYQTVRKEIELPGGSTAVVDADLVPRERAGVLSVRTAASAGTVFVDGKAVGNAPVELVVEAGSHRIAFRREGYDDVETAALVGVGEHKDVTIEPQKSAPITTKWWFWTGIGVVVAGGAALTVALLSEKKAGSGDGFSPSQVSGPLVRF